MQGAGNPHGTPSYELKYSNYWRHDFHGNAAFLLYRAEQPCTLRGTYRECVQKEPGYFTIIQRNEGGISTMYLGEKKELHFMHKDTVQAWQYKRASQIVKIN